MLKVAGGCFGQSMIIPVHMAMFDLNVRLPEGMPCSDHNDIEPSKPKAGIDRHIRKYVYIYI